MSALGLRSHRIVNPCLPVLLLLVFLPGCSAFVSSATRDLTDNLSQSILENNDLATVEEGAPAYLLMIDGFLYGDPDNEDLLVSAAKLYSAYASLLSGEDNERARILTTKGLRYAFRAACVRHPEDCDLRKIDFRAFEATMAKKDAKDLPVLFALGAAWASWIEAHKDDWNAVAQLSRIEVIMQRVIELDESYEGGGAHLYLGVLATLLPPALGGKPELGRNHFERAIEISEGNNLMAKVIYARQYARLVFDQDLHDRLLTEVLEADPHVHGYTLLNTLAQREARENREAGGCNPMISQSQG